MASKGIYARKDGAWHNIKTLYVNVGGAWFKAYEGWNSATGGTVTEYTKSDGTKWRCHTFTSSGTFTVKTAAKPFRVLVAGGGGGGGGGNGGQGGEKGGGSGGGGEVLHDGAFSLPIGAHAITAIGSGGGGGTGSGGTNGANGGGGSGTTFVPVGTARPGDRGGGGYNGNSGWSGASGNGNAGAGINNNGRGGGTAANYTQSPNGLSSDIDGTSRMYGAGGRAKTTPLGYGNGGDGGGSYRTGQAGQPGVVIVSYQIG